MKKKTYFALILVPCKACYPSEKPLQSLLQPAMGTLLQIGNSVTISYSELVPKLRVTYYSYFVKVMPLLLENILENIQKEPSLMCL